MNLKEVYLSTIRLRRLAFTLTELLMVVGVIALLMLITLPVLAGTSGQTKITQCAANLRQFNSGLQIYGNEHEDRLPDGNAGNWVWDMEWQIGTMLEGYGVDWKSMYCPGTTPRFNEQINWDFYNFIPGQFRIVGYALTFPSTASLASTNRNYTLTPQPVSLGFGLSWLPTLSERVLLADATISQPGQNNPSQRFIYNYTSIHGGYPLSHSSPHLDGRFPSGGNLSMLDGHVEWRDFEEMVPRTTGGGTPVFWW